MSRQRGSAVEVYLVYLLVGYYGLAMVLAALVHLMAASSILAVRERGTYLLGPAVSGSILLLGGAFVHGREVLRSGTFAWAKDGLEFLFDFVVPTTVLCLAWLHWQRERRRPRDEAEGRLR